MHSVVFEIIMEKQAHLPMGINYTKELKRKADEHGNEQWVLPHGMVLQVEDFYQEEALFEGDRTIDYFILSNKLDMSEILLVDTESRKKEINEIVRGKMAEKAEMHEKRKECYKQCQNEAGDLNGKMRELM